MLDAIIEASKGPLAQTKAGFLDVKRHVAGSFKASPPSTADLRRRYEELVAAGMLSRLPHLEAVLMRRDVRSLSGVSIVTVLTKPWPCPGQCVYCPSEARMPKSYLANEPAAARAAAADFDPFKQVTTRLEALTVNGHVSDKIELIIKGGTWSSYPWAYRQWFIRRCFDAVNSFGRPHRRSSRTLAAAQDLNERAKYRIIGLTPETRPDRITPTEVLRLRELGATRVELGVQSTDDALLALCQRGHDLASVKRATRLLKEAGFKVDFHLMPQLPGATPESDLDSIRTVFADPDLRPDMIKIYPCVVLATAELHDWWQRGDYRPYSDAALLEMLIAAKQLIPRYCRISRLIRDIPSTSILAGNAVTNLREQIQAEMRRRGLTCACLRCREIGHAVKHDATLAAAEPQLFDDAYEASGGLEHFLSFEDANRRAVFGFCRLRLPGEKGTAIIRELHVYGRQLAVGTHDRTAAQHHGLGRRLVAEAERLAKRAGSTHLAVISGIGVRAYYRILGYRRRGTYMVKKL
jgi:elongator complex protein 3